MVDFLGADIEKIVIPSYHTQYFFYSADTARGKVIDDLWNLAGALGELSNVNVIYLEYKCSRNVNKPWWASKHRVRHCDWHVDPRRGHRTISDHLGDYIERNGIVLHTDQSIARQVPSGLLPGRANLRKRKPPLAPRLLLPMRVNYFEVRKEDAYPEMGCTKAFRNISDWKYESIEAKVRWKAFLLSNLARDSATFNTSHNGLRSRNKSATTYIEHASIREPETNLPVYRGLDITPPRQPYLDGKNRNQSRGSCHNDFATFSSPFSLTTSHRPGCTSTRSMNTRARAVKQDRNAQSTPLIFDRRSPIRISKPE